MSIDLALKVGIGLLGASATSVGGYELHKYLTATLENKYSLLSETDDKWDQLIKKYETTSGSEIPPKIENFTLSEEGNKKDKLIDHCKKILKTSLWENQETLNKREKEVKSWCIENSEALKS